MSYDVYMRDPVKRDDVIQFNEPHQIKGGTFAVDGTTEAWLNITYNYADHLYKTMGEKGIRSIYGLSGADSIPVLENAISQLADDATEDYWESTEGNVKRALYGLLAFAKLRPDGIWDGD